MATEHLELINCSSGKVVLSTSVGSGFDSLAAYQLPPRRIPGYRFQCWDADSRLGRSGVSMNAVLLVLQLLLASSVAQGEAVAQEHEHGEDRARATHRFEDAEHWSKVWDHPSRDAWQEPERVVELMAIEEGMGVVDIGAGTGYFNPYLSVAVGAEGVVYAVDIEPDMIEHMRRRAEDEETPNVIPVQASEDDPRLPVDRIDRILMVDTYHHIDHRVGYFSRLREMLPSDGLFVNVDWKPGRLELGPAEHHKIAPEEVVAELQKAGFELVASEELKYQYVQIFRPRAAGDRSP